MVVETLGARETFSVLAEGMGGGFVLFATSVGQRFVHPLTHP